MKRDNNVYLHHIVDAIDAIEAYTEGMTENEFFSNSMAHDAVIRQLEIIGEAANNIPDVYQEKHAKIPWGKMIGIRNKIIHEYFNVNFAVIWDTVQDDLPQLKKSIKKIIK